MTLLLHKTLKKTSEFFSIISVVSSFMLIFSCNTIGEITSEPKSDILVLNSNYSISENIGSTPVEIDSKEILARYQLNRKNLSKEFLLVLYPEKVSGKIRVASSNKKGEMSQNFYNKFYDNLLRSHNLILKGDLTQAKSILRNIEFEFGESYGTMVLQGNIALFEGQDRNALFFFQRAKSLLPKSKSLISFLKQED